MSRAPEFGSPSHKAAVTPKILELLALKASRPGRTRDWVMTRTADKVGSTLDMLDEYIKMVPYYHPVRRSSVELARALCSRTNVLPSRFHLKGVSYDHRYPQHQSIASDVYQGKHLENIVAVKRMRLNERSRKEVITWAYVYHPHVLAFLGVECDPEAPNNPTIISRWMVNKTLRDYVATGRYVGNFQSERLRLAAEIASGLAYLHAQNIAHGDIKDTNILIGETYQALIADFGLARMVDITQRINTAAGIHGTEAWMAPERFDRLNMDRTYAMDVYAYGCICYMLCVGKHIFHWLDEEEVKEKILQGIRPDRPKGMDGKLIHKQFYQLMEKCWGQVPEKRINMNNILAYFHKHPSVALGPAAIFMAQARVSYVPNAESPLEIAFKKYEWFEIMDCTSNLWLARRFHDGAVGYIPEPVTRLYHKNLTIVRAVVINISNDLPKTTSNTPLLGVLEVKIGEVLDVLALDEEWWVVSSTGNSSKIGIIFCGNLKPSWPQPDESRTRSGVAIFSRYTTMNCHLDFPAGTVVNVQSHHATDRWLVGRANGLTGVVPAHYFKFKERDLTSSSKDQDGQLDEEC